MSDVLTGKTLIVNASSTCFLSWVDAGTVRFEKNDIIVLIDYQQKEQNSEDLNFYYILSAKGICVSTEENVQRKIDGSVWIEMN